MRNAISLSEGIEAMGRVLDSGHPQLVVSTQDLNLILGYAHQVLVAAAAAKAGEAPAAAGPAETVTVATRHPRPDLSYPYVAPRNDLEKQIAEIWSGLLGIENVGINDNFFDLGGHSLLATRVLARLQDSAGVTLPLETVFDAPTVGQMAERIVTLRWVAEGATTAAQHTGEREEFEL